MSAIDKLIEAGGKLIEENAQLRAENAALREVVEQALRGMVDGWRDYANGHYCRTYNPGMSQGLNCAADALEAYVNGFSAHPAPEQPQDGDEVGLLPCPFCGTSDALKIREDKSEDDPDWTVAYHVECGHCGCCGRNHYPIGWCESEQAAIEAWNHRGSIRQMYENPAPSVTPAAFEAAAPLDWRNEAK